MRTSETFRVDTTALETENYRAVRKRTVSPYCTSLRCSRGTATGSKKTVNKYAIDCPDCGHVLVWRGPEDKTTGWN